MGTKIHRNTNVDTEIYTLRTRNTFIYNTDARPCRELNLNPIYCEASISNYLKNRNNTSLYSVCILVMKFFSCHSLLH